MTYMYAFADFTLYFVGSFDFTRLNAREDGIVADVRCEVLVV